jgi:apolipoprotein N-acyltransferase
MPGAEFRPGWRGAVSLLHGPLRTLVLGQGVGQLGDGLAQVSFAQLVIFEIGSGATPARIASVLAVTLLPFSVIGPFAGVLIDRWDRRRTLVITSLCRAALSVGAVGIALAHSEVLAYAGVLLLLSSSRLVLDAKGAVLPRTVSGTDLVRANAISGLIGMTSAFVGAVGGAMFVSAAVVAGFAAASAAYTGAALAFLRLPWVGGGHDEASTATPTRLARELAYGLGAIVRTRELRRPLGAVALHRALLGAGFVLLVLVADQRYHLTASGYGLALAVTGVAAFAGTMLAPWLGGRWRSSTLLAVAFLPPAAATAVAGYGPTLAGLLVAVAITAVSFQCLKVLADALVGHAAPDRLRGRVFAVYDVLYNVAFVLAGLLMIPFWHNGRERQVLWWLTVGFTGGWLLFARASRSWPFGVGAQRLAGTGRAKRWGVRIGALAAGALPVLAFPQPALWWLAWFGLVPWLLVVRAAPTCRAAVGRGYWAATGFLIAMHYWLVSNTGPLLILAALILGALWLPWSAAVWWTMSRRPSTGRLGIALAVVPAGWVLVEAARSWSSLGGPWGLLGASQWHVPALLAPASLGGVWLVSLLIVAANVAVTALILARTVRLRATAAVCAAALVAAGPVWFALQPGVARTGQLRVAIVQPGVVHGADRRLAAEETLTRAVAPGSADLVVWGESSVGFDPGRRPAVLARLQALARHARADLLVNVDARNEAGAIEKTALLVGGSGILGSYQKMRLVPFGEYIPLHQALHWLSDFTRAASSDRARGNHLVVLHAGRTPVAPLICFEIAFPDMSRRAVLRHAGVLVYQSASSTFQGSWEPDQQAALAAVRAVETGRATVQAALTGTTSAFSPRGRRLAWFDTHRRGVVTVTVPLARNTTPYVRAGDWVLALSVLMVTTAAVGTSLRAAGAPEASRPRPVPTPALQSGGS